VTRDRAPYLRRTLAAIQNQDYPNFEVLVVDNASSDDTAKVIEDLGARRLPVASRFGIGHCRRVGVENAAGVFVAFCDDDTVPEPGWLSAMVNRLRADQRLGLLGGKVTNVGFTGAREFKGLTRWGRHANLSFTSDPDEADFFGNMNLAFRRDTVLAVGSYDSFCNTMAEIDLALRLEARGFDSGYEPAAHLEHHHTPVQLKQRHVFFGRDLIRLYLCMKHVRPRGPAGWMRFIGYELRLLPWSVSKVLRAGAVAAKRREPAKVWQETIKLFNVFTALLALPWLWWKTRTFAREAGPLSLRSSSQTVPDAQA
jgi:glycosyltransferase involved in cell wall biosynthesis